MKYNVGDKVRIKSLDWYNENKNEDGMIPCGDYAFSEHMIEFCGKEKVISNVSNNGFKSYEMEDDFFYWTDDMIEEFIESKKDMVSIKKVCEYLRTHLWQNVDDDNDPIVESVHKITLNGFIKDIKRYLEE
jgi:hypothetical protein